MADRNELAKFEKKSFRDGYLQTVTRGGIAYQIQALREKLKLTQTAFAERLGKKQSVVSRLENSEYGKVSVQTLLDIACSLDVALLVRFVSYPEFLARTKDFSLSALQPETIFESVATAKQKLSAQTAGGGSAFVTSAQSVGLSINSALGELPNQRAHAVSFFGGNDNNKNSVTTAAYAGFTQTAPRAWL